ncbi:MAG: 3,4-dihydroxy-2-butanone-4-phosphate synthase [Myxococcales bacterium]|jgi:3,4-dihydroxy 2-butanone 4-phosphate synthase/GTP cyclohydrolase II
MTDDTTRQASERVERALEDIRAGKMVVLVDDEQRENEGDLVMAGDMATPEAVNFMARYGRGLICLAMERERVDALKLPMMVDSNEGKRSTAFTVSIEAREGVTTGISAADRARTIQVAVDPSSGPEDIVSPGHVFPLRAVPGGVLQRAGHTEGSVDLARLAGRTPSGVICEIMNEDGTMARMPQLEAFAAEHGLQILSIADLIQYRLQREQLVRKVHEGEVTLPPGNQTWQAHVFETPSDAGFNEILALTLGAVDDEPIMVRVQVGSVLGDVFGARWGTRVVASEAVRRIEEEGRGVVLYIPPRLSLATDLRYHLGEADRMIRPDNEMVLREIGFGAQVLRELGVHRMRLLTNQPRRVVAADGYGLEIVEQVLLRPARPSELPPPGDS